MKSRPRPVTGRFCASVTAEEGTIGKNPSYLINNFFQKNRNPLFLNSADPYFRKHLFLLVSLSCGRKKKKKKTNTRMRNTISPKWKGGKMLLSRRWWLLFHQHLQERFHWRQEQRHRPCLFRDLEFCKTGCMQIPGEAHWSTPWRAPVQGCKTYSLSLSSVLTLLGK